VTYGIVVYLCDLTFRIRYAGEVGGASTKLCVWYRGLWQRRPQNTPYFVNRS